MLKLVDTLNWNTMVLKSKYNFQIETLKLEIELSGTNRQQYAITNSIITPQCNKMERIKV